MDASEFANFIARELLMEQFGVHSGVPTLTTATLTPTTLKTIEQTFIEATNDAQINLPYQAGFVPPPYPMEEHSQDGGVSQESLSSTSNGSWHISGSHGYTADDLDSKSSASLEQPPAGSSLSAPTGTRARRSGTSGGSSKSETTGLLGSLGSFAIGTSGTPPASSAAGSRGTGSGGRRNVGGRRPHKPSNLSPEEEEKRRIRRERNKQAAARCRRRREDHTNDLVDETDQLEKRRQSLQHEIQQLQQEKDELEFLLESHRKSCSLQAGARRSPIELKPTELEGISRFVLPKIKTEPEEEFAQQQQQSSHQHSSQLQEQLSDASEHQQPAQPSSRPSTKKIKLPTIMSDSLETPTPTSILAPLMAGFGTSKPTMVTSVVASMAASMAANSVRPARPDSLDVKSAAQYPLLTRSDVTGAMGISTPSSGLFNFESLMEGGTGLTPIAAPITFPPNRNPLELITPTSTEPSKLCSL
ncbi:transcription factor kayak [Anopheles nili]|uniref:transcription factor kayak n=1 Tax=Anopheles nili TaxID=185578 RepID=UPI00237B45F5|nr:transcription factor kayak [Anopheles nili]XP_053678804.1 transcription factor kayak [Anopheles nili]